MLRCCVLCGVGHGSATRVTAPTAMEQLDKMTMSGYGQELVIRTKLVLPRARRYLLRRPALAARLLEALYYRLTVVQASTGYGKSTALVSALQEAGPELFWYSITETDQDPLLFLLHLVYVFRLRWPEFGAAALGVLQEAGTAPRPHRAVIDALSNELVARDGREAVLVLDDFHAVNLAPEVNAIVDYFLEVLPPDLHLIVATRYRPALKTLNRWRVKGELLEVGQADLAFSADEIEALFRTQYGLPLSAPQVQRLAAETEGWVIALQMIWQGLQSDVAGSLDQILEELPRSLQELFVYLAQEVLARRPAHIQDFLLRSSVLRQLDPAACDYLLNGRAAARCWAGSTRRGFFWCGWAMRYCSDPLELDNYDSSSRISPRKGKAQCQSGEHLHRNSRPSAVTQNRP